jgi:hypothetical protein
MRNGRFGRTVRLSDGGARRGRKNESSR